MKKPDLSACLFFALCCGVATSASALETEQLFRKIEPSVWLVRSADKGGVPLAAGSAVVIAARRLVTNCHVLKQAASVLVIKGKNSFAARLDQVDLERDLCLLAVDDEKFSAPAVRYNAGTLPVIGQHIVTIGNPAALEMSLTDGLISRLQYDDDKQLDAIQFSAPISVGSSGGGLFDTDGYLLGITQRQAVGIGVQNLNFALPAAWLDELKARSDQQLAEYYSTRRTTAQGNAAKQ